MAHERLMTKAKEDDQRTSTGDDDVPGMSHHHPPLFFMPDERLHDDMKQLPDEAAHDHTTPQSRGEAMECKLRE
jgi:hypothetical protein